MPVDTSKVVISINHENKSIPKIVADLYDLASMLLKFGDEGFEIDEIPTDTREYTLKKLLSEQKNILNLKKRILKTPIDNMPLSIRTFNCFYHQGIMTLGDIVSMTPKELLKIKHFGRKSLHEIRKILHQYELKLKDDEQPSST